MASLIRTQCGLRGLPTEDMVASVLVAVGDQFGDAGDQAHAGFSTGSVSADSCAERENLSRRPAPRQIAGDALIDLFQGAAS
jgi:hypothetical protein